MNSMTSNSGLYGLLLLFSYFFPCFAIAKQEGINKIQFNQSELLSIKSLSSDNYPQKRDESNNVSGNTDAIALGKTLFFSAKLSGDGSVSCTSCHKPEMNWSDHQKISIKRPEFPALRHTPSILGVKFNRWYFWDGRADSLWSQALEPIESDSEMAGSRTQVAYLIIDTPDLRHAYESIFGDIPVVILKAKQKLKVKGRPVFYNRKHPDNQVWMSLDRALRNEVNTLFANVGKSIAAFEETLVSRDSPFDKFSSKLPVKKTVLNLLEHYPISSSAIRGLKLFVGKARCIKCHFGPNLSDSEFHHSFLGPTDSKSRDLGRYQGVEKLLDLSRLSEDVFNEKSQYSDNKKARSKLDYVYKNIEFRGQFKTPSLRNVAKTYPYMHTGEFETLNEVVHYYNTISERIGPKGHQEVVLGSLNLSKHEQLDLIEFLKSLTDTNHTANNIK